MRLYGLLALLLAPINALASIVDDELHCLALNIYHEARGEPREGQLAVAYVTMNRLASSRYPDTVCDVVWQYKQFSWTHDGRSDRPTDKSAWRQVKAVAEYVYKNYFRFRAIANGATDITRGALYYYAPRKASPRWAQYKRRTTEIGAHVFLKDDL